MTITSPTAQTNPYKNATKAQLIKTAEGLKVVVSKKDTKETITQKILQKESENVVTMGKQYPGES